MEGMHNQPRGHKLPKEPGNWNENLVWVEFQSFLLIDT